MPARRLPRQRQFIKLLRPSSPGTLSSDFAALAALVVEAATWFYSDSQEPSKLDAQHEFDSDADQQLNEAIEAGLVLLAQYRQNEKHGTLGDGAAIVDFFCNRLAKDGKRRLAKDEKHWRHTLSNGREIGQRHLLCAMNIYALECAARLIREDNAAALVAAMVDVVELSCEIRKCLDREYGSDLAARRARKGLETNYLMRAEARKMYRSKEWKTKRQAARYIRVVVNKIASEKGGRLLTADRGIATICGWLSSSEEGALGLTGT